MEHLNMHTPDITETNIQKIGELFPNCLTERLDENGKPEMAIDFDKLRQELSKEIVEGPQERYQFTWPDKRNAMRLANTPTNMTLRPCREESVDFNNTENLYIEGDNLEVLKLLRENYLGKVKMIYIDPPYNTGNDFVYNDDFAQDSDEYKGNSGQTDDLGNRMVQNTESNGRFHTNWLNMMYPRLKVARDLLTDDGVIFISIDDNEQNTLKFICDEIFGHANFVTTIHIEMSATQGMKVKAAQNGNIVKNAEYIIIYTKNGHKNIAKNILYDYRPEYDEHYSKFLIDGEIYNLKDYYKLKFPNEEFSNLADMYKYSKSFKSFVHSNVTHIYADDKITGFTIDDCIKNRANKVERNGRFYVIYSNGNKVRQLLPLSESFGPCDDFNESYGLRKIRGDWWKDFYKDMGNVTKEGDMLYANGKKPVRLLSQLIKMCTSNDDIIIDFFSGSATTAHGVINANIKDSSKRKFIMVQIPDAVEVDIEEYDSKLSTICEIGKERIRRAGKKIKEENPLTTQDLDTGFRVLKLDSSNMEDVYYTPEQSGQTTLYADNVKSDRTSEDLLFQVMLECNLPLSAKIEKQNIAGKEVFNVNDGYLIACFDTEVSETLITAVAKQKPYYFVMRDSSLSSDNVADNFEQIFKAYSKDTVRRIL